MQTASPARGAILSAAQCSAIAREVFPGAPLLFRLMQRYRPYICPFELLLEFVPYDSTALDIGCGGGLFLALLAMLGRRVHGVGIDASVPAIQCARLAAAAIHRKYLGSTLDFQIVAKGQAFPEGPFHVVSIIDVMHHVPRSAQQPFFEAAIERIAPGGLLIYKDIAVEPLWRRAASRFHDLVIARQWIHEVPLALARPWAEASGLVCLEAGSASRFCYAHEYGVFRKPRHAGDSRQDAARAQNGVPGRFSPRVT